LRTKANVDKKLYMGSNTRVRPRRTARDLLSTGDAKSLVDRTTCLKNPAWQAVET